MCLKKNIAIGLKLKPLLLGEKYSLQPFKKESLKKFPISLSWCSNCKNVQTNEVVLPKLLWSDFTYLSGQTKDIIKHFEVLTKKIIRRFKLKANDLILDIGSNDGTFLKFFKKNKFKVLGVDPAKNLVDIANKNGIQTIAKFFDDKCAKQINKNYKKPKLILCFNTFAHTEKIRDLVKNIKYTLHPAGFFIFECQYLKDIYDKKIIGTIFHEHMYHHSITSLKNLFEYFELNFFDVEKVNIQKGSIIGYVSPNNKIKKTSRFIKLINDEKKGGYTSSKKLKELKTFIQKQKNASNRILKEFKNQLVGSYGSARSGPTYALNFEIDSKIKVLFDDHPLKRNKYSGFLNLKVNSTKQIDVLKPKLLVILAYLHTKKIIKNNIKYIKKGGNFLSVYPKIDLINKKNYRQFI